MFWYATFPSVINQESYAAITVAALGASCYSASSPKESPWFKSTTRLYNCQLFLFAYKNDRSYLRLYPFEYADPARVHNIELITDFSFNHNILSFFEELNWQILAYFIELFRTSELLHELILLQQVLFAVSLLTSTWCIII